MAKFSVVNRILPLSPLTSKSRPLSKQLILTCTPLLEKKDHLMTKNSFYMDCKILLKDGGHDVVLMTAIKVILLAFKQSSENYCM